MDGRLVSESTQVLNLFCLHLCYVLFSKHKVYSHSPRHPLMCSSSKGKKKEEEEIQKNGCMLPVCPILLEEQVSWKLYQEIFFYVSFIRTRSYGHCKPGTF